MVRSRWQAIIPTMCLPDLQSDKMLIRQISIEVDAVPATRVSDIFESFPEMIGPEEWYCFVMLIHAGDVRGGNSSMLLRDTPMLDASLLAVEWKACAIANRV